MYQSLTAVTLRNGQHADIGVVHAPDHQWADTICPLLAHKGGLWNWQVAHVLKQDVALEARFYLLHQNGTPLSHIMTLEYDGVGIFGHVWTVPAARRQGASSQLIAAQMADFAARGGRALFLGTDFESSPYHIYQRVGFGSIEPGSGYMAYYQHGEAHFSGYYWATGEVQIEPFGWQHYPRLQPLFMAEQPAIIRNAGMHNIGRGAAEEDPLNFLHANSNEAGMAENRAAVMVSRASGAVVGFASWTWHVLWPSVCLVDIFCYGPFWDQADALFGALKLPDAAIRTVAYSDAFSPQKSALLVGRGFAPAGTLAKWLGGSTIGTQVSDITIWDRE